MRQEDCVYVKALHDMNEKKKKTQNENEMTTNLMMTSTKWIQRAIKIQMETNEPKTAGSFTQERNHNEGIYGQYQVKFVFLEGFFIL